jgi:putative addiction module component (TIGR02574 family)
MAVPLFDFSHLTAVERIELAQQLWDSLGPDVPPPTAEEIASVRARRAGLDADGEPGEPWQQVLDEIEQRGE